MVGGWVKNGRFWRYVIMQWPLTFQIVNNNFKNKLIKRVLFQQIVLVIRNTKIVFVQFCWGGLFGCWNKASQIYEFVFPSRQSPPSFTVDDHRFLVSLLRSALGALLESCLSKHVLQICKKRVPKFGQVKWILQFINHLIKGMKIFTIKQQIRVGWRYLIKQYFLNFMLPGCFKRNFV